MISKCWPAYVLCHPVDRARILRFMASWGKAASNYTTETKIARFYPVEEIPGMNSERFPRVPFWRDGNGLDRRGHTACYWGHVQMWRQALARGDSNFETGSALFFEDDAILDVDFWPRALDAYDDLPDDWDILYLGGQHCIHGRPRPEAFSKNLYKIQNVNRLHAYAIRLSSLPKIILWFEENHDWGHNFNDPKTGKSEAEVDYAIGSLTESGFLNGYALRKWAAVQGAGKSWTQGRAVPERRFELD